MDILSRLAAVSVIATLSTIGFVSAIAPVCTHAADIAFSSNRDGYSAVYVMDVDGSGVKRISREGIRSLLPSWQPGKQRLAYIEDPSNGNMEGTALCTVNADGTGWQQLTPSSESVVYFSWRPKADGFLVYIANPATEGDPYRLVSLTSPTAISALATPLAENSEFMCDVVFSPSGDRLAFSMGGDIWSIRPDDKVLQQMTSGKGFERWPQWTPDGSEIEYSMSDYDDNLFGNFIVDAASPLVSKPRPFLGGTDIAGLPAWSPDGERLAFAYLNESYWGRLVLSAADGAHRRELRRDYRVALPYDVSDFPMCWSPDGQWLYFGCENMKGIVDIYRIRRDGSDLSQLTVSDGIDDRDVSLANDTEVPKTR